MKSLTTIPLVTSFRILTGCRKTIARTFFFAAALAFSGCTTVSIYQNPVSRFQTAVNDANDAIRPYLLGVNDLIAEANLYDKVGLQKPWGTEDLHAGIPEYELQVRLQALSTIAGYADALAAVANAQDVKQVQQAASELGDDVKGLSTTVQGLGAKRQAPTAGATAAQAAKLDLSGPVSALVSLVGTGVVEHKQKAAVEAAILNGAQPVNQLIDLLKTDLHLLTLVDDTSYAAIQSGLVKLYDQARNKADPKSLIALIDEFVQKNDSIQTLRALQVDSLLSDMASAHTALVVFAKSSKSPKDLSDLAGQMDVFTAHVKLFGDAIASIQATTNKSK